MDFSFLQDICAHVELQFKTVNKEIINLGRIVYVKMLIVYLMNGGHIVLGNN